MKNKILTISIIFILLSFIFINNNVFAASYDLSDYSNHIGSYNWCIIYSYKNDNIYLLVCSDNSYNNIYCVNLEQRENGDYGGYGDWVVSKNITTNPWGTSRRLLCLHI